MEGVHDSWSVYTSVGGGVGYQSGLQRANHLFILVSPSHRSSSDGQSGVIHYMPDDADDFDDEDPDDDLDF